MTVRRFLSATLAAGLVALVSTVPVEAKKKTTTAKATAECNDGTFSHAKTQQGACSKHGGVKTWYGEAGAPETAPAAKAPATTTNAPATTKTAPATTAAPTGASKTSVVAAPADAPAGTTAKCKDGTFSQSKTHSGTCSHHGGVAEWYK